MTLNLKRNTFSISRRNIQNQFYLKRLKTSATDWKGLLTTADPIQAIKITFVYLLSFLRPGTGRFRLRLFSLSYDLSFVVCLTFSLPYNQLLLSVQGTTISNLNSY